MCWMYASYSPIKNNLDVNQSWVKVHTNDSDFNYFELVQGKKKNVYSVKPAMIFSKHKLYCGWPDPTQNDYKRTD